MAHERVLAAVRPTGPSCNGCTFPYGSIVKGERVLVISLRLPLADFIGSMRPVSDRIQVTSKTAPTTWGKGKRRRQRKGRAGMFAGWADHPSTKSGTSTSHSSPGGRTTPHHHGHGRDHGPSVHLMSGEWMISRRACFMPSLGRFKEIFWNQDSLTRQGGTTTWGPRLFRSRPVFLLFHALRLAAVRMPGQFSGSRKCNHGIFPRLSAPLGAAPSQDIINGARNAAAAAIVICCCSGNKQPREEKPAAVPALLSQPSHVIGLVQNQGTPVHTTPVQHTVSMASHVSSVSVSCRVSCRFGRTALDSRLQAAARREKNGVCQALHPFDGCDAIGSGRPVVIDTSIFPQVAGKV